MRKYRKIFEVCQAWRHGWLANCFKDKANTATANYTGVAVATCKGNTLPDPSKFSTDGPNVRCRPIARILNPGYAGCETGNESACLTKVACEDQAVGGVWHNYGTCELDDVEGATNSACSDHQPTGFNGTATFAASAGFCKWKAACDAASVDLTPDGTTIIDETVGTCTEVNASYASSSCTDKEGEEGTHSVTKGTCKYGVNAGDCSGTNGLDGFSATEGTCTLTGAATSASSTTAADICAEAYDDDDPTTSTATKGTCTLTGAATSTSSTTAAGICAEKHAAGLTTSTATEGTCTLAGATDAGLSTANAICTAKHAAGLTTSTATAGTCTKAAAEQAIASNGTTGGKGGNDECTGGVTGSTGTWAQTSASSCGPLEDAAWNDPDACTAAGGTSGDGVTNKTCSWSGLTATQCAGKDGYSSASDFTVAEGTCAYTVNVSDSDDLDGEECDKTASGYAFKATKATCVWESVPANSTNGITDAAGCGTSYGGATFATTEATCTWANVSAGSGITESNGCGTGTGGYGGATFKTTKANCAWVGIDISDADGPDEDAKCADLMKTDATATSFVSPIKGTCTNIVAGDATHDAVNKICTGAGVNLSASSATEGKCVWVGVSDNVTTGCASLTSPTGSICRTAVASLGGKNPDCTAATTTAKTNGSFITTEGTCGWTDIRKDRCPSPKPLTYSGFTPIATGISGICVAKP